MFIFLAACSPKTTRDHILIDNTNKFSTIHNPDNALDLTAHLRRVPGVSIQGEGASAKIFIRGINTIHGPTEPLFILDDDLVMGGYAAVYNIVQVNAIKRIEVLKDPGETGIYGVRGTNGVIVITTK